MLRAMAAAPPPQPEPKVESWMDVGEEVMDALQKQLDRAMEERVSDDERTLANSAG